MMNGHYGGYDWGMGWGIPFGPILMLVIVIAVVYLLLRPSGNNSGDVNTPVQQTKPVDILKQRYARGEIDRATFEHMKKELE